MVYLIVVGFFGLGTVVFYSIIQANKKQKEFRDSINDFNKKQRERDSERELKRKKKKYI